jgi:hypothetical protein
VLIVAEAEAQIRKIEAESRNFAADSMKNAFGQQYAIVQQQVEFAKNLQATSLTVGEDSLIGRAMNAHGMQQVKQMSRA